jgi:predicted MFS family arabinose efflux permease
VWGWRGDFLAIAALLAVLAVLCRLRLGQTPPTGVTRVGYLEAFRQAAAAPGAVGLLLGSLLRSITWLGWITYLAAYYAATFAADSTVVAIAWSLGGSAFFAANLLTGRRAARSNGRGWTAERLLLASLVLTVVVAPLSLLTPTLPLALIASTIYAGLQGAGMGATISLLVGRYTTMRGAMLGLNAAGLNLAAFAGAALVGAVLGLAGFPGAAVVLALVALAALGTTAWAVRR